MSTPVKLDATVTARNWRF